MLLRHTDNLSKSLQQKFLSAEQGQRLASLTIQVLESLHCEEQFIALYTRTWQEQRQYEVGEPVPKRRRRARRFEVGESEPEFPQTPEEYWYTVCGSTTSRSIGVVAWIILWNVASAVSCAVIPCNILWRSDSIGWSADLLIHLIAWMSNTSYPVHGRGSTTALLSNPTLPTSQLDPTPPVTLSQPAGPVSSTAKETSTIATGTHHLGYPATVTNLLPQIPSSGMDEETV